MTTYLDNRSRIQGLADVASAVASTQGQGAANLAAFNAREQAAVTVYVVTELGDMAGAVHSVWADPDRAHQMADGIGGVVSRAVLNPQD